jgi:hypothetical protein
MSLHYASKAHTFMLFVGHGMHSVQAASQLASYHTILGHDYAAGSMLLKLHRCDMGSYEQRVAPPA